MGPLSNALRSVSQADEGLSYGGIYERGAREYTLDDFYSLQLDKLDKVVCLKESGIMPEDGVNDESEEEDDDEDDDGDSTSTEDDEDADVAKEGSEEGERDEEVAASVLEVAVSTSSYGVEFTVGHLPYP